jgi:hypothetical protein
VEYSTGTVERGPFLVRKKENVQFPNGIGIGAWAVSGRDKYENV